MTEKQLQSLLENTDHEKIESYIGIFDRILLYTLAASLIPKETVKYSMEIWESLVKKGINLDSTKRTNFLEETVPGRAALLRGELDGEEYRLHCIKHFQVAKSVIENNIRLDETDDGDLDTSEF